MPVPSGPVVVGRSTGCDLVLSDASVSGTHARFESGPNGVRVTDLESRNGVKVGGVRVEDHLLAHGDRVELGKLALRLEDASLLGPAPAASGATPEPGPELEHLDPDRVRRGTRPLVWGALVLAVVASAGVVAWRKLAEADVESRRSTPVVAVPGNLLDDGSLEEPSAAERWSTESGVALEHSSGARKSGGFGLAAFLPEEGPLGVRSPAVRVREGRAVRASLFARAPEGSLLRPGLEFTSSTDPARGLVVEGRRTIGSGGFDELALTETVLPGFDTVRLRVTATGPGDDSLALDDATLIEVEPREASALEFEEYALYLHGERSDSATLMRIGRVAAAGLALVANGERLPLDVSDSETGFTLRPRGSSGPSDLEVALRPLVWELGLASLHPPASTADGEGTRGTGGLQRRSGEFEAPGVRGLLVGEGTALVRLGLGLPTRVKTTRRGDELVVRAEGLESLELQLSFRADRNRAADLADAARRAERDDDPSTALAAWAELLREVPVDAELVAEAELERARLLREGLDGVEEVRREFGRARFFDLPEIYARNLDALDRLVQRFAGSEVERAALELEAEVRAALAEHVDRERARQEAALARVAGILEREGAQALADHVRGEVRALSEDGEGRD